VKAYGDAAKAVLDSLKTEELIEKSSLIIVIGYDIYEQVKLLLQAYEAVATEDFSTEVTVRATVASNVVDKLVAQITDLSAGRARIEFPQDV
jgi:putative IMPACT (imprinted ancient) family translation regulator